jgi:hypothetical protein
MRNYSRLKIDIRNWSYKDHSDECQNGSWYDDIVRRWDFSQNEAPNGREDGVVEAKTAEDDPSPEGANIKLKMKT